MLFYLERRVAVQLSDGEMIRGVVACSWVWGALALKDATLLPVEQGGEVLEFAGTKLLLSRSQIVALQVGVA